jgi:lipopolysaccharide transport system ATP-binding protein
MSAPAITVNGLGKRYRLGALGGTVTLRHQFRGLSRIRNRGLEASPLPLTALSATLDETGRRFWALKDVSFEIEPGEVVGIIGRNGAGKSTLLKILTGITDPTEGVGEIRGRVGSLLEVGTGFHSELTGRENVYLGGAIMGMRKAEIRAKFDEILDFAGVERFVDTPVKRYSSGMYVRLAFGVAAFLEPEILLIDEVLAVGDSAFQKRCLGKMNAVAKGGRTVLLVSHNMGAISQLCQRCIWLDDGKIRMVGDTAEVVSAYLAASDPMTGDAIAMFPRDPSKPSQVRTARLVDDQGDARQTFSCDEPLVLELLYEVERQMTGLYGCLQVSGPDGTPVLVSYSYDNQPNPMDSLPPGPHLIRLAIPARSLGAGSYRIGFSVGSGQRGTEIVDDPGTVASFTLNDMTTVRGNNRLGYFSTILDWEIPSAVEALPDAR